MISFCHLPHILTCLAHTSSVIVITSSWTYNVKALSLKVNGNSCHIFVVAHHLNMPIVHVGSETFHLLPQEAIVSTNLHMHNLWSNLETSMLRFVDLILSLLFIFDTYM